MLLDARKPRAQHPRLVVLLVHLAEADRRLLPLNAAEHLHVLSLDVLYLLLAEGGVQRPHLVVGCPRLRGLLPFALAYLFEQQPVFPLYFGVFGFEHVLPLGVFIQEVLVTDCAVSPLPLVPQLVHLTAVVAHVDCDFVVAEGVFVHGG